MTKNLVVHQEGVEVSELALLNTMFDVSLGIIDRSVKKVEKLVMDTDYRVHPETMEKIKSLYNRLSNIINTEIPE